MQKNLDPRQAYAAKIFLFPRKNSTRRTHPDVNVGAIFTKPAKADYFSSILSIAAINEPTA